MPVDPKPDNMTLKATVERSSGLSQQPRRRPQPSDENDREPPETTSSLGDIITWPGRIAILVAVVLSPWFFASVDYWAQSYIAVALLLALGFWWFETSVNRGKSQVIPYLFLLVLCGLGIGVFQTLPLPGWLVDLFVGRQAEIYAKFSGNPDAAVSVSLDRQATWQQVRMLVLAASALLLGARYFRTRRDVVLLMSVISLNGAAISFFGIVHKLTDEAGQMFWYHKASLGGQPFGPFVNRNNGAGYLLMCLACCIGLLPIVMAKRKGSGPRNIVGSEMPFWRQLYYHFLEFIAELSATKIAVLVGVVTIGAGVISTISRGGVLALLVGAMATILLYGMARRPKNSGLIIFPLGLLMFALSAWVGFSDQLLERFDDMNMTEISSTDIRFQHWQETLPAVADMGMLGSGLGSYPNVHRLYRQGEERFLFEFAENQFFQSLIEAGPIGCVVFLLAWFLAYHYCYLLLFSGSSPTSIGVGTMGMFMVFSEATASTFDFGMYIPANMLLMAVLMGTLGYQSHAFAGRLKRKSWLQRSVPNAYVQVVVLLLFAGGVVTALELNRRASQVKLLLPHAKFFDRETMDLRATEQRLLELQASIDSSPTIEALNYNGELRIHHARLQLFREFENGPEYESFKSFVSDEKQQSKQLDSFWQLTDLSYLQENLASLRRQGSKYDVEAFIAKEPLSGNLPDAINSFLRSRQASPLQPLVHLRLGLLRGAIGGNRDGDVDIERAIELAPSNADFRILASVYYLQSNASERALPHLRRFIELDPLQYRQVLKLLRGGMNRTIAVVPDRVIFEEILPADPTMLHRFATEYMDTDSPLRPKVLQQAIASLDNSGLRRAERCELEGDLYALLERYKEASAAYDQARINNPGNPGIRYKLAKQYDRLGQYDDALKLIEELNKADSVKYGAYYAELRKKKRRQAAEASLD